MLIGRHCEEPEGAVGLRLPEHGVEGGEVVQQVGALQPGLGSE